MSPKVSVIVPLWNSAATIGATLESLRQQTLEDWEAIVIDDGSTDGGPALARRIADEDSRVRVISQANAGLSAARNAGLALTQGEFVHFLDADDSLPPDALASLVVAASKGDGASYGAFAWVEPSAASAPFVVEIPFRSMGLNELLEANRFPVHAQLIARSLIGAERFDESLHSAEDWDMWLRLAARGVRWAGVDTVVAHYHLTPGSMSRNDARMLDAMTLVARTAFAAARTQGRNDCDASRDRERSVRLRLALECATRATLEDETPNAAAAWTLLSTAAPAKGEINPRALATAAYWTLPQAARRTPGAWRHSDPRWLSGLGRFWMRCEREGCLAGGGVAACRAALGELLVDSDAIVCEIVREAGVGRSIELIGLGRNGRRIARALTDAHIPFAVRDDAIAKGWTDLEGVSLPARSIDGAYANGALAIVSVEQDSQLLSRLPREVSIVRWSTVRARLAGGAQQRLLAAWPGELARECAA